MRVLVAGGTGFFGRLVAEALVADGRFEVLVAGRREPSQPAPGRFVPLDLGAPDLAERLGANSPDLVIHCAGPYVAGHYGLVEAALACGIHYVDLAEDRRYVTGIGRFDDLARRLGLTVLSGVSSVPALSSAVVAEQLPAFARLDAVDVGITSTERLPGLGAVRGVLGQCGRDLITEGSGRALRSAWTDAFPVAFPEPVGERVLARCDVPDLALFPERFPGLARVTFRAGVALPVVMAGLRAFARMRRRGWIRRPEAWAGAMTAGARLLYPFGNGASGMFVRLAGEDADGDPLVVMWTLVASNHRGVWVPARGAVAVAEKLFDGGLPAGARPCFTTLSVGEYLGASLPVAIRVDHLVGDRAVEDEARWQAA